EGAWKALSKQCNSQVLLGVQSPGIRPVVAWSEPVRGEDPLHQRRRNLHFAVLVLTAVLEGATIGSEVKVAPGFLVLVSVQRGPVPQLNFMRPHKVGDEVVSKEFEQRIPVGRFALGHLAASFSWDHLAILSPPPQRNKTWESRDRQFSPTKHTAPAVQ